MSVAIVNSAKITDQEIEQYMQDFPDRFTECRNNAQRRRAIRVIRAGQVAKHQASSSFDDKMHKAGVKPNPLEADMMDRIISLEGSRAENDVRFSQNDERAGAMCNAIGHLDKRDKTIQQDLVTGLNYAIQGNHEIAQVHRRQIGFPEVPQGAFGGSFGFPEVPQGAFGGPTGFPEVPQGASRGSFGFPEDPRYSTGFPGVSIGFPGVPQGSSGEPFGFSGVSTGFSGVPQDAIGFSGVPQVTPGEHEQSVEKTSVQILPELSTFDHLMAYQCNQAPSGSQGQGGSASGGPPGFQDQSNGQPKEPVWTVSKGASTPTASVPNTPSTTQSEPERRRVHGSVARATVVQLQPTGAVVSTSVVQDGQRGRRPGGRRRGRPVPQQQAQVSQALAGQESPLVEGVVGKFPKLVQPAREFERVPDEYMCSSKESFVTGIRHDGIVCGMLVGPAEPNFIRPGKHIPKGKGRWVNVILPGIVSQSMVDAFHKVTDGRYPIVSGKVAIQLSHTGQYLTGQAMLDSLIVTQDMGRYTVKVPANTHGFLIHK
jgi:hypothetical protein